MRWQGLAGAKDKTVYTPPEDRAMIERATSESGPAAATMHLTEPKTTARRLKL